ncbi:YgfZ/GcvT domain-containing protein [Methylophaga sp. OBS3]|uniref:CAF17-like 4Fe-4S cluster assembly/insertion protein YgfZ n=1 Tax=Methylophaga sp. OBS3 TaxID=2991934 RepID=UPI0022570FDC|nr:hypothetical protein [Methylophaga sp. OBS3]MCX4190039.1 hypothetical protein [Methylophaga sp. OBS3]
MTDSLNHLLTQQQELDEIINQDASGFAVLSDWQAVEVNGEDAETFLQSLLTNDVKASVSGQAQLNGFCQAKGRLLAIFWLIRREQGFILMLPVDQAAFLAQRLSMFKLRSKVNITPMTDAAIVAFNQADMPSSASIDTNLTVVLVTEETVTQLTETGLTQQPSHAWQQQLLRAGYPMIFASSREKFTAQQVNLDIARGVSFRKGCYPGQEVVARLHYLGEAKRRLFIGEVTSHDLPEAGADILTKDGEVAGQLVQSCSISDTTSLVQLTLKLALAEQTMFINDGVEITELQQFSEA